MCDEKKRVDLIKENVNKHFSKPHMFWDWCSTDYTSVNQNHTY
jgi:uncharacterized membrane-anchored protein YhcB (DUF1043 family)